MEKDKSWRYFGVLLVFLVAVALAAVAFSFFSQKQAFFSEAYFGETPKSAFSGKGFSFDFFIENHEGAKKSYFYWLLSEGNLLADRNVSLFSGEKKRFSEQAVLYGKGFKKIELFVSKGDANKAFELFFWVELK